MKPDINQVREALRGILRVWKDTSMSTATRLCFKESEWSHEMKTAMDEARSALASLDGMVVIPADEYEILQLYKAHSTADLKGMMLVREGRLREHIGGDDPSPLPSEIENTIAYLQGRARGIGKGGAREGIQVGSVAMKAYGRGDRLREICDKIEAEPLATGEPAESVQMGRLQVVDEIRQALAALKGMEEGQEPCPKCGTGMIKGNDLADDEDENGDICTAGILFCPGCGYGRRFTPVETSRPGMVWVDEERLDEIIDRAINAETFAFCADCRRNAEECIEDCEDSIRAHLQRKGEKE